MARRFYRSRRAYVSSSSEPRFDDYRRMNARFESECKCGKKIKAGDEIAYARGAKAMCIECFDGWAGEVNEEAMMCDRNMAIINGYG